MINTSWVSRSFFLLSPDFHLRVPGSLHCKTYTVGADSKTSKRNPTFLARELRKGGSVCWREQRMGKLFSFFFPLSLGLAIRLTLFAIVVQSLSRVWLLPTPWTAACLSFGTRFPVLHYLLQFVQTHVHWVGDAIQTSHPVAPFSSCPQSLPASGSFPVTQLFASGT